MNSDTTNKTFFLKWLRILLDEHTSADLSALHHKYNEKWSTVLKLTENHDKPEQLKAEQTELERISEELQAAAFGLEHIMREIGQIYESCSSVKKNKEDLQFHLSSLPSLAAEMMISGFPLELMDGDAAHVPVIWISAVLDQLIQKLGDQRVFVLSVLGLQSSGKSTMLNAMFGLQFAVSAGRCTRGAFMQLLRVSDEMKTQMNFYYILVVDTEGLYAPELSGRSTRHQDNELVTFVVGLETWREGDDCRRHWMKLQNSLLKMKSVMQKVSAISVDLMFRKMLNLLKERFIFSFRNSLEISAYRKLETKYRKWSWSLRSAMMETENKLHNKIEYKIINEVEETDLQRELKETSEEVKKSMSEFFEKDRDKDKLIQWKTSFEIKIRDLQENIVRETKRKLNDIPQQRHLKKKTDAQRTHHENTLYEKSKELAIKLQDKANDEEKLKKEFDLFWEQSVKKIRDNPPIKEIDIVRDVREILSDNYKSAPIDHWRESRDIFTLPSYSDYVNCKNFTNKHEAQIRSLVTDVIQQTDNMIQSFNISKMGYNKSCLAQLIDYVKTRVTEHQKYVFKNEFFMDLVLSICKRANKMITDQHRLFRDANDPEIYVEKKREEYYSIFQKYCHGAASAAIFGEIICQKLKEPIEQSVYKKTAKDLTYEMRSNCESLNGNRSNLEKHILKTLAEEEDFDKYMNYINNSRDHFKDFIRDEVSQYITDKFSVSVLPKMKENIKLLQQKIMKAAHESTELVQESRRDVGLWLKSFTQQLSDVLIFSEKDLSGVKHDGVKDFNLLEDVIKKELPAIMSDISSRFNTKSFDEKLYYKFRPEELLIDHFSQCCWVQCPFCGAIFTNTIENHPGEHSTPFHSVTGLKGMKYRNTTNLSISICTSAVASYRSFYPNDSKKSVSWRKYRNAGGIYTNWSITPDLSELLYWKWFVCGFQKDLKKYYNKTSIGYFTIPDEWKTYSKRAAIESLNQYM
ncbi:interferon-induced very large GTPase 1-like [Sinocyclocheilus rhinocerous]|uniref:interferon-induced very large GTPase 1-like n=1 Tax=Sinocyclocheilus rhinocerous TaxID=307959 RepID=UPI0007B95AF0|nr:PREDICTED: interferon-induced very large GTPase 1-like [Sinocyclocheilus rhinocerous]